MAVMKSQFGVTDTSVYSHSQVFENTIHHIYEIYHIHIPLYIHTIYHIYEVTPGYKI